MTAGGLTRQTRDEDTVDLTLSAKVIDIHSPLLAYDFLTV